MMSTIPRCVRVDVGGSAFIGGEVHVEHYFVLAAHLPAEAYFGPQRQEEPPGIHSSHLVDTYLVKQEIEFYTLLGIMIYPYSYHSMGTILPLQPDRPGQTPRHLQFSAPHP